ncbi:MAG TPA: hypothetical protein VMT88_04970, partial [Actinomycetes bacterium]|nr:hypothetical protein [Actinomycetes bacterium]
MPSSRVLATALLAIVCTAGAQATATPAMATSPQSRVTGVVRTADGTPIAGIRVHLGRKRWVTTDASGTYGQWVATGRTVRVTVARARRMPANELPQAFEVSWQGLTVTQDTTVDLTLPPTVQQTFTVLNGDGAAVSYGRVRDCYDCAYNRAPRGGLATGLGTAKVHQRINTVSSGESTWVFNDPRYEGLWAEGALALPEGWGNTDLRRELRPMAIGVDHPIRVRLPQTGVVSGAIRSVSGEAQQADLYTRSLAGQAATTTDSSGSFNMVVPLGDNDLTIRGQAPNDGHWASWYLDSTINVNEHTRLPVRLSGWQTTQFEVNDSDGVPILEAGIQGGSNAVGWIGTTSVMVSSSFETYTDDQ